MNKFLKILTLLLIVSLGIFSATSLAFNSYSLPEITAYGMDTVAGSPTILTSSETYSNSQVIFEVSKPDGSSVSVYGKTDSTGIAKAILTGENTKMAGTYGVSAKFADNVGNDKSNNFSVLAGPVSKAVSKVTPSDQVVASFDDQAFITVTLTDDYGNPIQGHNVRLISDSAADFVQNTSSDVTDVNGQIIFVVSSRQSGAVSYTAYDSTADLVLDGKANVAYYGSRSYVLTNNIPSNHSYAAFGNSSGVVDHLSFEQVPMIINPGQNISFKVSAYDQSEQLVVNYNGAIHFSVESGDENYVTLPSDYTFTPQDLGSHTFSIALGFNQAGSYQLRVQDTQNEAVYGQFIFIVGSGGQQGGSVTILSPISGTYSNNMQVVTGIADPGAKLKVFDNDIELTSLMADSAGLFSYTTGTLSDGLHKFTVAEVNDIGTILYVTPAVDVNIDTAGVKISNVIIEPSGTVNAGAQITVKLYSTDKLSSASMTLSDNIYQLTADPSGFYFAQITAPTTFGEYSLSFTLKDELGNETKFDNHSKLVVQGQLTVPEFVADVTSLTASSSDRRVILTWNPVVQSTNPIQNYRVYIGASPTQLTTAIDTFTSATTWYIPNLENGTEYYFGVVAVDTKGNISEHFSNIVSAIPNPLVIETPNPDIEYGLEGEADLEEMGEDASKSGPEILWLVLVSAIGGICYSETARRKKL